MVFVRFSLDLNRLPLMDLGFRAFVRWVFIVFVRFPLCFNCLPLLDLWFSYDCPMSLHGCRLVIILDCLPLLNRICLFFLRFRMDFVRFSFGCYRLLSLALGLCVVFQWISIICMVFESFAVGCKRMPLLLHWVRYDFPLDLHGLC